MAENMDGRSPIQDPLPVPSSGDATNNPGQGKKNRRDDGGTLTTTAEPGPAPPDSRAPVTN